MATSDDDFGFSFDFIDPDEVITGETHPLDDAPYTYPEEDEAEQVAESEPVELSDDDVDAAFFDIAAAMENDEEVQKAAALIIEAEAIVAKAEERHTEVKERAKALDDQRKELEKQLAAITREKAALQTELWDVQSEARRAQQRKSEAEKQAEIARQAVEAKAKFGAMEKEYLRRAKGKAWFEGIERNGKKLRILDHQWTAAKFMASSGRVILGDGMGLGKTLSAIAALDLIESKKALIIVPADVASNFVDEVQMWAPHRPCLTIKGYSKAERNAVLAALTFMETVAVVVNYEAWRKDNSLLERFADQGFDTLILDEAHTIKSTSGDAYKGVEYLALNDNVCPLDGTLMPQYKNTPSRVCPKCNWQGESFNKQDEVSGEWLSWEERYWLSKSIKNVWNMTGTPILNSPADVFPMLRLIDPHTFDNRNEFLRMYCEQDIYTGRWKFRDGGLDRLVKRLSGRYLARTYQDAGIVLPEQKPIVHSMEIDPAQYRDQFRVIQQLSKHAQIILSDGRKIPALATIALITRQRQANVWPGGIELKDPLTHEVLLRVSEEITESIKMDKAIELIREFVDQGKRIALFSQFTGALVELQRRVNGMMTENGKVIRSVQYDGTTPDHIKDEVKRNFNKARGEESKWDVVFANYKSGGVGLNFTEVEHTIVLDEEWNPGKRDQAYARSQRMGQDKETFVHLLFIKNTIDEWLHNLIQEKEDMIAGFESGTVDIQEALLKALTSGEIIS